MYYLKFVFFILIINLSIKCNSKYNNSNKNLNNTKDTSKLAIIKWNTDSINFKTIKEGKIVNINFELINISKNPLIIEYVQSSCGCTIVEYNKNPILSNAKSIIKVKYNSKDRGKGSVIKLIKVFGNFLNSPKILIINGDVK